MDPMKFCQDASLAIFDNGLKSTRIRIDLQTKMFRAPLVDHSLRSLREDKQIYPKTIGILLTNLSPSQT